jgi:hypothetical protein
MQIDFHHAVTYVVARFAGFSDAEAATVAYAAQYVDDATNEGVIKFSNGALYRRLATAHRMIDERHLSELSNRLCWMPFHFLPGNGGLPPGQSPKGGFIERLICKPDSPIARDMADLCLADKGKSYGLHRLGITAHVYADTWAHQHFAGVWHDVNDVEDMEVLQGTAWKASSDRAAATFVPKLGHGQASTHPDQPYLHWRYKDGLGRPIERNNTDLFLEAANALCRLFQRWIRGASAPAGLSDDNKTLLGVMLRNIHHEDGERRHAEWLEALKKDHFGFGSVDLVYISKGKGSWKHKALGTDKDTDVGDEEYQFNPAFLASDWKMFHDAAKLHQLAVIDDILPRYGIVAA